MQRLILIRHAKAERDAPSGDDFDRPLSDRGRHEAARVGVRLAECGFTPDLAIVSAAARTRETWEQAAKAWGAVETRATRDLYEAEPEAILDLANRADDADTLAMVLHNPSVQALAVDLLRRAGVEDEAKRASGKFPTASAVVFDLTGGVPAFEGVFYPSEDPADR